MNVIYSINCLHQPAYRFISSTVQAPNTGSAMVEVLCPSLLNQIVQLLLLYATDTRTEGFCDGFAAPVTDEHCHLLFQSNYYFLKILIFYAVWSSKHLNLLPCPHRACRSSIPSYFLWFNKVPASCCGLYSRYSTLRVLENVKCH